MGSSLSITQLERAFRKSTGNSRPTGRLRVDEDRANMGGLYSADHGNDRTSSAGIFSRQRAVLAGLIGGEYLAAEETATLLMSAFGSVCGVLTAQPTALSRVLNNPELVKRLTAARAAVVESLSEKVQWTRFEIANQDWQQWIVGLFKGLRRERLHLAYLDSDRRLITDEALSEGDLSGVTGSLRHIVRTGFGVDASRLVLMHNHPSGNAEPSRQDIDETRRVASLLATLDLQLEDHVIVAGNTLFSMRGASLI